MKGDLKDILVNGGTSTADGDSDVEAEAAMTGGMCGL